MVCHLKNLILMSAMVFFFFKQKTAYEMRISDWSSDVCSSDLLRIFDQVYNMTTNDPGGPLNSTKPLVLMIYQTAFTSFDMGYAAAQTVVLFLVLLVVSLVQLRIMRDR